MTHTVRLVKSGGEEVGLTEAIPFLNRALEYAPEYLLFDIIEDFRDEECFIFTVDDGQKAVGALVARVEEHPQKSYLQIHLLGGDNMDDWIEDLRGRMRELAVGLKLDGVALYGRPGWTKIFPTLRVERIIMIDEIKEAS